MGVKKAKVSDYARADDAGLVYGLLGLGAGLALSGAAGVEDPKHKAGAGFLGAVLGTGLRAVVDQDLVEARKSDE